MKLAWNIVQLHHREALLGKKDDGVRFTLTFHPTCYRRGPYRLLIEICGGPNHHKWGCFDAQDQPLRYYHDLPNAQEEAQLIADVLVKDRDKHDHQWRCDRSPEKDAGSGEVPVR